MEALGLEPAKRRPACPQQPNVYLEPKWLRCKFHKLQTSTQKNNIENLALQTARAKTHPHRSTQNTHPHTHRLTHTITDIQTHRHTEPQKDTYTHTDTQTQRHTTQRQRHTHAQTCRHTDTQRH